MPGLPRNVVDLFLAPVALAVDSRINEFAVLDSDELTFHVALVTNLEPRTEAGRAQALLDSITAHLDMHGWDAAWDSRGIRLTSGDRTLILGVPATFHDYVATAELANAA